MDFFSVGTGFTIVATREVTFSFSPDSSLFVGVPVALSLYTSARYRSGVRTGFGFTLTGSIGRADLGPNRYQGPGGVTLSFGYEVR